MPTVWMETFTPNEAAALSELSEKQVRKELEYHVIEVPSPPRLSFAALVYLRALKLIGLQLKVDDRIHLAHRLLDAVRSSPTIDTVEVGEVLALRIGSLTKDLVERVRKFARWKKSLVTKSRRSGLPSGSGSLQLVHLWPYNNHFAL